MRRHAIMACLRRLQEEGWQAYPGTGFSWWFEESVPNEVDGLAAATALPQPVQVGHDKRCVGLYPALKDGWIDTPAGKMLAALVMKAALRYTKSAVELGRRLRPLDLSHLLDEGKLDTSAVRTYIAEQEFDVGDHAPLMVAARVDGFRCVACVSARRYTELDIHLSVAFPPNQTYVNLLNQTFVNLFAADQSFDILAALPQREREIITVLFDRYQNVPMCYS